MRAKLLNILITTHCNLACEHCSNAVPSLEHPMHMSWDQLVYLSAVSRDLHLPKLVISGGEPMVSPIFHRIAANMRSLFSADHYELRTNGLLARKHLVSLKAFDSVTASFYPRRSPDWMRHLPDLASNIRLYLNTRFWNLTEAHPSKQRGEPWKTCYAYRIANAVGDRMYPCCNMFGVSVYRNLGVEQVSVPTQRGWPAALDAIDMRPLCRECGWPS